MAIPVDLVVVVCVAATVPTIDVTVVVIGAGVDSSGSIVLINGMICTVYICT